MLSSLFFVPQAQATTWMYPGIDMGMNSYMGNSGYWLSWTNNTCRNNNSFNWYVGGVNNLDSMPTYPYYYGQNISSLKNMSQDCNTVWLTSGPWDGPYASGFVYWVCLKPGQVINNFGYPYNDNVQRIGLNWTPGCSV